jgi:hypothetical protein
VKTRTQRVQAVRQADLQANVGRSLAPAIALTVAVLAIIGVGLAFSSQANFAPAEKAQSPAISAPQPPTRIPATQAPSSGQAPSVAASPAPAAAVTQASAGQPTLSASPAPLTQAACEFSAEFSGIVRTLGRDTIGECMATERGSSAAGNAQQRTTRGLLVWLSTEQVAAFTNGSTTWYNCASGVKQQAFNDPFPC